MSESSLPALGVVLFAAGEPVTSETLVQVLEVPAEQIRELTESLSARLAACGLQVIRLAGGYRLATRPEYAEYVHRLREPVPERLSRSALETLTIASYKQPVTRAEVEAIRGVDSSHVLGVLVDKGLLEIAGRKAAPGRPVLYRTTDYFLSAFGLGSLEELPNLEGLRQTGDTQLPLLQPGAETLQDAAPVSQASSTSP